MQPLKFPLLYIPQIIIIIIIIIRKRNRRALEKRTKINVLFLKVGAFLCKKKVVFRVVMQMQQIPEKSFKQWLHDF
jgi:hypothetical protein